MKTGPKLLVPLVVVCLTFTWAHAAFALGGYAALDAGDSLAHPALAPPGQATFSIFAHGGQAREDALNAAGYFMDDPARQQLASPFSVADVQTFAGTMYSEVWQYRGADGEGDGHLLFLYRVENSSVPAFAGAHDFHSASVYGAHWANVEIIDAGIIRPEAGASYIANDLSAILRPSPTVMLMQLGRWWKPIDLVTPGESSPWFYLETTALNWGYASAQVNGSVGSEHPITVYAPAPEPGTICLLGLGAMGLGGYVRRRRAAKTTA